MRRSMRDDYYLPGKVAKRFHGFFGTLDNDPRINDFVIPVTNEFFILLSGVCNICHEVALYKRKKLTPSILDVQGVDQFVNHEDEDLDFNDCLWEYEVPREVSTESIIQQISIQVATHVPEYSNPLEEKEGN